MLRKHFKYLSERTDGSAVPFPHIINLADRHSHAHTSTKVSSSCIGMILGGEMGFVFHSDLSARCTCHNKRGGGEKM